MFQEVFVAQTVSLRPYMPTLKDCATSGNLGYNKEIKIDHEVFANQTGD